LLDEDRSLAHREEGLLVQPFVPEAAVKALAHTILPRHRCVVDRDFRTFARLRLPGFKEATRADSLYSNYRNGLVHEARLKNGCQFQLGLARTCDDRGPAMVVDPARLLAEVRAAVAALVAEMRESAAFRREMVRYIEREFAFELGKGVS